MFGRIRPWFVLALALLTGCGVAPQLPAHQHGLAHAHDLDYTGSYLSVTFEPSDAIANTAMQLRSQLGFVDMTQAIPARKGDELHVTVGYFKHLAPRDAEAIAETFRNHDCDLTITGYGVASNQAAYFTVEGIDEARHFLESHGISFDGDDPHVTFGVNPSNPRDVHGVPKKSQQAVGPFKVHAQFHLEQGIKAYW